MQGGQGTLLIKDILKNDRVLEISKEPKLKKHPV